MAPHREEAMTSRDVVIQVNKYTTPTASRNAKTKTLKKKNQHGNSRTRKYIMRNTLELTSLQLQVKAEYESINELKGTQVLQLANR